MTIYTFSIYTVCIYSTNTVKKIEITIQYLQYFG